MSRFLGVGSLVASLALVAAVGSTAAHHPRKKRTVHVVRSTASQVVVARGRPVEIAFVNDEGSGFATSLANAVQMAVDGQPSVRGFPIQINMVNVSTCGNPANAGTAAANGATTVTANLQNVAVLGQVCSFGF